MVPCLATVRKTGKSTSSERFISIFFSDVGYLDNSFFMMRALLNFEEYVKIKPTLYFGGRPYRSNTGDDRRKIDANLETMTRAALDVFRLGHLPVLGESLALPLIRQAGSRQIGDALRGDLSSDFSNACRTS